MTIFLRDFKTIVSTMNLIDLPEEALHHIFKYIPEQEVFWNLGFCCLRLHGAVLNYIKHVELQLPSLLDDEYLARRGSELTIQDNLPQESHKMQYRNFESLLDWQALMKSITYVAVGKIQCSIYAEEITNEIEQNHSQYCSELPSGSPSSKVRLENQ